VCRLGQDSLTDARSRLFEMEHRHYTAQAAIFLADEKHHQPQAQGDALLVRQAPSLPHDDLSDTTTVTIIVMVLLLFQADHDRSDPPRLCCVL
jgi:hypothetical protein